MKRNYIIAIVIFGILAAQPSFAHCPLCTAGAGLAAIFASWLGVGSAPIGVFIGAFAVALGLWIGGLFTKQYIPRQKSIIAMSSFATTIFPLMPLMQEYSSLYLPYLGEYGKTYLISRFLVGSMIGALVIFITPFLSKRITLLRGKTIPFQGLSITFVLLVLSATIIELWIW